MVSSERGTRAAGRRFPLEIPPAAMAGSAAERRRPAQIADAPQESSDRVLADPEMVTRHAEGADIPALPVVRCQG